MSMKTLMKKATRMATDNKKEIANLTKQIEQADKIIMYFAHTIGNLLETTESMQKQIDILEGMSHIHTVQIEDVEKRLPYRILYS